ncbi:SRPBCC domain-containing protein [Bacillus sp. JJ664]
MDIVSYPNLSNRPYSLQVEREMEVSIDVLYHAWTEGFGSWFAAPDSVIMEAKVNSVFFFETEFNEMRHPHYGRFLKLEQNRLVEITWITAGTKAETVVTVEFVSKDRGVMIKLTHAGFSDELSRNQHEEAWPYVLEQLDKRMKETIK